VVVGENILGTYFRRPSAGRRKYRARIFVGPTWPTKIAWARIFVGHHRADENSQSTNYFRRPWESRRK
jgi:NADH:ubiquinone oxidoreductase subunit